jgi:chromosome segregation ATPase
MEWLEVLEDRVREAAALIQQLKEENQRLQRRLQEVEEQLKQAQEGGDAGWQEERDEIRQRVASLAESLGNLLADAEA